jgi:hypothetical protein
MSHKRSYTNDEGIASEFFMNADGSGNATIVVWPADKRDNDRIEVPFEHLKAFVLDHFRDEKIRQLEQAEGDDLARVIAGLG